LPDSVYQCWARDTRAHGLSFGIIEPAQSLLQPMPINLARAILFKNWNS